MVKLSPVNMLDIKGIPAEQIPASMVSGYIRTTEEPNHLPACTCGNMIGKTLVGSKCPDCHTSVVKITDRYEVPISLKNVTEDLWLKPQICVTIGLLLPKVTVDGEHRVMGSLDFLVNGNKLPSPTVIKKLELVKSYIPDHKPGYSFFISNIDKYLDAIGMVFKNNSQTIKQIKEVIKLDSSYTEYLNTPSKILNESTDKVTKLSTSYIIEAIAIYRQIHNDNPAPKKVDRLLSKILFLISDYTYAEHKSVHTGHGSITRRSLFSTPLDYTVRSTVLPILEPHKLTDVHHSYKPMVALLRPFILKHLLLKHPLTETMRIYHHSVNHFNQEVYDVMMGLIENSREDGLPFLVLRNPTQSYPSIFKAYVVKIGKDPDVDAMFLSTNGCIGPNWDHDGDQMGMKLLIDEYISTLVEPLKMYNNISQTPTPYWTSGVVGAVVGCDGITDAFLKGGTPIPPDEKFEHIRSNDGEERHPIRCCNR